MKLTLAEQLSTDLAGVEGITGFDVSNNVELEWINARILEDTLSEFKLDLFA